MVRFGDRLFGPNVNQGEIYRLVNDALITADFDADGDVDGEDFLAWQRNLGATAQGVAAAANSANVPEPSSLGLLLIAMLVLKSMANPFTRISTKG